LRKYIVDVNLNLYVSSEKLLRRGEKNLPNEECIDETFEIFKEENTEAI